MSDTIAIDCLGMRCPRPIIEIAKAARRCEPGTRISIRSDDLAFESDVKAWIESAHATLLELVCDGREVHAVISL